MSDKNKQFNVEDILKELKATRQDREAEPLPSESFYEQSRTFDKAGRPQQRQMGESRQPTKQKSAPVQKEMSGDGRRAERKASRVPNVLTPEEILGIGKPNGKEDEKKSFENEPRPKFRKRAEVKTENVEKPRKHRTNEDPFKTVAEPKSDFAQRKARLDKAPGRREKIVQEKSLENEDIQKRTVDVFGGVDFAEKKAHLEKLPVREEKLSQEKVREGGFRKKRREKFSELEDLRAFERELNLPKKVKPEPEEKTLDERIAHLFNQEAKEKPKSREKQEKVSKEPRAKGFLVPKMTANKKPIRLQGDEAGIENRSLHKSPEEVTEPNENHFATRRVELFEKTREMKPLKPAKSAKEKVVKPDELVKPILEMNGNDIYSRAGLFDDASSFEEVKEPEKENIRQKRVKHTQPLVDSDEAILLSPEQEFVGDYENVDDVDGVYTDLVGAKKSLTLRAIITFIILMLTSATVLFNDISIETLGLSGLIWFNVIAVVAVVAVNFKTTLAFVRIFKGKVDSECMVSVLLLLGLGHTLAVMRAATYTSVGQIYAAPIIFVVLAFVLSQLYYINKTLDDFEVLANDQPKNAGMVVCRENEAAKLAGEEIIGEPMVFCQKKSINIKGFLKNSFSKSPCDRAGTIVLLCGLGLALVFGVTALIMTRSAFVSISAAVVVALGITPIGAILGSARSLAVLGGQTREHDAVVVGHEGVRQLCEVNSVVLNSEDLFPVGCTQIRSIKCFNGESEDKAIVTAAALALKFGGTLGQLFDATTMGNYEILPAVANVKYENLLGISGFVGEAEAKLGVRAMMEENSIKIPPVEIEKQLNARGARLLYLSIGVNLAAIFVLNYKTDEEIRENLYELAVSGVQINVYTKDPILTENMVGACFRLPKGSVRILDESAGQTYKEIVEVEDDFESVAVNLENANGACRSVTSAFLANSAIKTVAILQVVAVIFALVFAGYTVLGGGSSVSTAQALIYQAVTLGVCYVSTLFFRR